MRTKEIVSLALRGAITVGLLYAVSSVVDLSEAGRTMAAANLGLLAIAVALIVMQGFVVARRWAEVLRANDGTLAIAPAVKVVFIGNFFNQLLLSAFGGDVVRMWLVRHHGVATANAITGVLVDRACALLAVLILIIVSAPWVYSSLPDQLLWGAMMFACAGIAGAYGFALLSRLPLPGANYRWAAMLGSLPRHLARVLFSARWLFSVASLGFASHAISMGTAYVISLAIGAEIRLVDLLAVFPWVILATALPISVAGWGVREGAIVWGFALLGAPRGEALALSLLYGAVTVIAALPGLLFWLSPRLALRN